MAIGMNTPIGNEVAEDWVRYTLTLDSTDSIRMIAKEQIYNMAIVIIIKKGDKPSQDLQEGR